MNLSDLSAITLASLAGSLHCAAMCGPFMPLLSGDSSAPLPKFITSLRLLAYHLGRGIAYTTLGAIAGVLGEYLEQSGALWGMRHAAALAMAIALLLTALSLAWPRQKLTRLRSPATRTGWVRRLRQHYDGFYQTLRRRVLGLRRHQGGTLFALALGLSSALLPCGWLWGFVLLAATRPSVSAAMLTMLAFWLGTLPVLSVFGHLAQRLRMGLGPWTPRLGALALACLAIWTLVERWPSLEGQQVPAHCESPPR